MVFSDHFHMYFRSGASTLAALIGSVPAGAQVGLIRSGNGWNTAPGQRFLLSPLVWLHMEHFRFTGSVA